MRSQEEGCCARVRCRAGLGTRLGEDSGPTLSSTQTDGGGLNSSVSSSSPGACPAMAPARDPLEKRRQRGLKRECRKPGSPNREQLSCGGGAAQWGPGPQRRGLLWGRVKTSFRGRKRPHPGCSSKVANLSTLVNQKSCLGEGLAMVLRPCSTTLASLALAFAVDPHISPPLRPTRCSMFLPRPLVYLVFLTELSHRPPLA